MIVEESWKEIEAKKLADEMLKRYGGDADAAIRKLKELQEAQRQGAWIRPVYKMEVRQKAIVMLSERSNHKWK